VHMEDVLSTILIPPKEEVDSYRKLSKESIVQTKMKAE
jgi:hypothetical protein